MRKTLFVSRDGESSSEESGEDGDENWVPGSEEVRRRNKKKQEDKRFVPEFLPKPQTVPVQQTRKENSQVVEDEDSAFDELGKLGEENAEERIQYATRGKKHSYCEAEVPDDDHYIFCEECQDLHYGDCPVHGPLQIIADSGQVNPKLSAAVCSLPTVLKISKSSIPGAGLGVFSTTEIPKGVRFGPYKGKKIKKDKLMADTNTNYMWEIVKDGKFSHFVDGKDESQSNWMRFVNCSRCEDEQNLVAYQFRGEIYYRTYKSIKPGQELLVWYGESYAKDLGISLSEDGDSSAESGTYTCDGCERMYTSMNFLLRHKKYYCSSMTKTKIFQCTICEKEFPSLVYFNNHINCHADEVQKSSDSSLCQSKYVCTDTDKRSYQCTQCDKAFKNARSLTVHLRTHTGEKPYQCTLCHKTFIQSCNLTKHLRTHTGKKPYQCTQCDKAFNQYCNLTVHLRTHTGKKPYQCTQCDKAFTQSCNLTVHLRTHTGKKPYQCTQCDKAFNQHGSLTKHLRTHTGKKPYQCTQCDKAFTQSCNLTVHIRTHTGQKPYQCTQCHKAFNSSGCLTVHLRTHTGEKPYQCTRCDKAFSKSSHLTSHHRTHAHRGETIS